ncbi:MAG TPA: hypothetical protein VHM02_04640, partial [Thermoanaerobaculia bacterium]|nr:hypothetical protein [Thermoanaerobaculia bacterium]
MVARLLAADGFDRRFSSRLVEVARDARRPWELRRLAAWMLEQQALALDPRRSADRDWLLGVLGLLRGGNAPADGSAEAATAVARSAAPGTSLAASPAAVFADLRRRLARLERFHRPFAIRRPPSAAALADFLDQARREAKLTLARWLVTPEEVADRARALLRMGRGRPAGRDSLQPIARRDGRRALAALPAWDRRFLARLLAGRAVLWSGEATPEEVGALVEAPAGTVVTIVRPPGSDLEIELKRTGRRGARPLGVVFRRDGQKVAAGHRNDGASMTSSLAWEARASAMAGELFRRVHRREAPLPSIVSLRSVETVPAAGGPVPLAAWLDDPAVFGDGFAEMRRAMEESVAAFDAEGAEPQPSGEAEGAPPRPLVERYLAHVAPAQAVLVGTSAFRLDRLDDHLRRDRPLADFAPEPPRDAAGRRDRAALRRVADEVLEEAFGLYRPPEA